MKNLLRRFYGISHEEFGDTPIRTLLMYYSGIQRVEASEMLRGIFVANAAANPGSDTIRHQVGDLRETAMGDYNFDRRRASRPTISKEEYFRRMEAMGHKAIEV